MGVTHVGKIIRVLILFYDGEPFCSDHPERLRKGGHSIAAEYHAHTPTFHPGVGGAL